METHRANAVRNTRRRTGRKDVQTAGRTHQGVQIRGRSPASGQKFRRIALKNLEIRIFYIPLHSQLGNMPCGNSSVGRAQPCQGWGREFESRFPLLESATYRNEVADFLFTRGRERDKSAFPWPWLPLPLHKTLHWKHVFPPASNDAKQWLSNKYPGKDTVNKPPLCPLRPRDKRRKPVTVK